MRSLALLVVFVLSACGGSPPRVPAPDALHRTWVEAPADARLASWDLEDGSGQPFDEARLHGRFSVVFVGYTSCPDVCPLTLRTLARVLDAPDLQDLQAVFLAVDPERDRPVLGELVAHHHPRIVGVTGTRDAIDHAVSQLGAAYQLRASGLVDHSTSLFLVDPTGQVRGYVLRPSDPDRVAADLRAAIASLQPVRLSPGWVPPSAPGVRVLAGFGALQNEGAQDVAVVGWTSELAREVALHRTVQVDGMARARRQGRPPENRGGRILRFYLSGPLRLLTATHAKSPQW